MFVGASCFREHQHDEKLQVQPSVSFWLPADPRSVRPADTYATVTECLSPASRALDWTFPPQVEAFLWGQQFQRVPKMESRAAAITLVFVAASKILSISHLVEIRPVAATTNSPCGCLRLHHVWSESFNVYMVRSFLFLNSTTLLQFP